MSQGVSVLRPKLGRFGEVVLLIVILLAAWQLVHEFAGAVAMTAPLDTFFYTFELVSSAAFWPHAQTTMLTFALALMIAGIGGIIIGASLGFHRLSGEVAEPILVALYSVPKVTLYPIILMFFGLGLGAGVAFGALHGVVPIIIFTLNAVRNIQPVFLKTARVMGLRGWSLLSTVLIPATLPEIFTGLRVGFSVTLVGTLISEMFGSHRGLGFLLMRALGVHDMDMIMAITLLLVAFASVMNSIMMRIERRLYQRN